MTTVSSEKGKSFRKKLAFFGKKMFSKNFALICFAKKMRNFRSWLAGFGLDGRRTESPKDS